MHHVTHACHRILTYMENDLFLHACQTSPLLRRPCLRLCALHWCTCCILHPVDDSSSLHYRLHPIDGSFPMHDRLRSIYAMVISDFTPFTGGCVADLTPSTSVPPYMSDVANQRRFLVHVRLHPVHASSSMHDRLHLPSTSSTLALLTQGSCDHQL